MQQYDFDIIHIPGKLNVVPDALSRCATANSIMISDEQVWRDHQARDPFCNETIRQITSCSSSEAQERTNLGGFYISEDGILVLGSSSSIPRIVVPSSLKEVILAQEHSIPTAGHQGVNRTVARVAVSYFWVGWRRDVADYVNACKICQQAKDPQPRHRPHMHVTSTGPNDLVAMDLQGPLVLSQDGNKYILVIQDIFTKFVQTVAIKDMTAISVFEALMGSWIQVFGPPHRLLTDNGANFTSSTLEDLFVLLKIQKLWTSPYRPQTDGSVERLNKTISGMLKSFISDMQDDWDQFLPMIVLAYNCTYNYKVRNSPFFLMMGRQPPTATELLAKIPAGQLTDRGEGLRRAMRLALNKSYNELIRLQDEKNTIARDQLSSIKKYQLGEEVMILDFATPVGLKDKHRRRWTGPYLISKINGPLSYEVTTKDKLKTYRAHADHIKAVYKIRTSPEVWPLKVRSPESQEPASEISAPGVSSEASSPGHRAAKLQTPSRKRKASSSLEGENVVQRPELA